MITVMVILISMAITIYFGDSIKTVLPINLLFLLLFVQVEKLYRDIRSMRHDMGNHIQTLEHLVAHNNIDDATEYLEHLKNEWDEVELIRQQLRTLTMLFWMR